MFYLHNKNNEALLFMGKNYVLNWKSASLIRDSHISLTRHILIFWCVVLWLNEGWGWVMLHLPKSSREIIMLKPVNTLGKLKLFFKPNQNILGLEIFKMVSYRYGFKIKNKSCFQMAKQTRWLFRTYSF